MSHHSSTTLAPQIKHIVVKKRKENWSDRKIAKFLGVNLKVIRGMHR